MAGSGPGRESLLEQLAADPNAPIALRFRMFVEHRFMPALAEIAEQLIQPISAAISKEAVNQGLDIEGVKQNVKDRISEEISGGLRGLTDQFKK